jgi:Reverse transcriptase (RNA-dependent DNA polymerase)
MFGKDGISDVGTHDTNGEDDDDDDESWRPGEDESHDSDGDDESSHENEDTNEGSDAMMDPQDAASINSGDAMDNEEEINNMGAEDGTEDEVGCEVNAMDNASDEVEHEVPGHEDDTTLVAAVSSDMDSRYGSRNHAHGLRPRRPRDFAHLHVILEETVMTQYSMNRGIKEFGEAGIEAVLQELQQLHDRGVLKPIDASSLSREDRERALAYLMFLKQKRDGKVKGRGCADGRKQRQIINKEDASSPTVSIEAVFITCVIDAHEGRDGATVDLPGAFMQADMDELVHMKLEGTMAELLVKINPKMYRKYLIINKKGKPVLYVELLKALYGTLKAALLFWKKLVATLREWGFETNPYDWCVANKMINGKQCTVLWHVDDLKISHVEYDVVSSIIELIRGEFGKEAPLTETRGKTHEYLGMTLDFSCVGKAKIYMTD